MLAFSSGLRLWSPYCIKCPKGGGFKINVVYVLPSLGFKIYPYHDLPVKA